MWLQFFLWVASFILSDYFRERLPPQTPSGIGDFNIPTATEGRYVAIIPGGTIKVQAANCVWYGDFAAVERTVTTGVIFKEDEVIGFTYHLALQYVLLRGQVAGLTRVWIGDDEVFEYVADNAGVPATVVDIDRDDLFGGVDNGGGFKGRVRLFDGHPTTQPVSTFLSTRLDPLPAYRGYCYVMITSTDETEGADIGESNTLRYLRFEVQTFDTLANGGLGNRLGLTGDTHFIGQDANPISVAYEIYLNEDWGRNFAASEVNLTNFRANAATLHAEGLGYSELIDGVTTTGALVDKIAQHIDGYIGPNPVTGQIEITLARADYTPASEFQATGSNLVSVSKWDKGDWTQTFNQTRMKYSDRNKNYKDTYALAQASGNRLITGRLKSKEIEYAGCHEPNVANLIVHRDQRGLAQPLSSGTLILDRTAYELRPGSIAVLTDNDPESGVGETNLSCRVTKVTLGGPLKQQVQAEVVQDIFDSEVTGFIDPPDTDFVPPIQDVSPFAAVDQAAIEAPFIITKQDPVSPNTFPRGFTMARVASAGSPTSYEVIRRTRTPPTGFSGGYTSVGFITGGFMTVGTLRNAETAWKAGNGTLTMQIDAITGSLSELIGAHAPGGVGKMTGVAIINPNAATEEWIAFSTVVVDGGGIRLESLFRACMDTAMQVHSAGVRIWFIWTGGAGIPTETFTEGDGVDYKFLPTSPTDAVLEPAATSLGEVSILDRSRYLRPLLPSTFTIDSIELPTGNVSADTVNPASPAFTGIRVIPTHRFWRTINILSSVQGLNNNGGPFSDSDVTGDKLRISWWLYNLDVTPSPTRGVDEIVFALDDVLATAADFIDITRLSLINSGINADFSARIELETSHEPAGFGSGFEIAREPFFFDFPVVGTWSGGSVYADIYYHSHFDGADAATTAVDESDNNHTTTFVGNAQIDTAQSKFGGSALLLDGTGDYVTIPDGAGAEFGSGDFTLECFVRFNGDPGAASMDFITHWATTGNERGWLFRLSNNDLQLAYSTTGTDVFVIGETWNPADATWYHVAVVRLGTKIKLFVDGTQLGAGDTDISTVSFNDSAELVWMGASENAGPSEFLNGWLEEVRIHKGHARYVGNFTAPTTEFFFHRHFFLTDFNGPDGGTTLTSQDRHLHTVTFNANAQLDSAQQKFGSASLLLDGTGDECTVPDNADLTFGTGDFTVETFVRFAALPSSTTNGMAIASHFLDTGNQRAWFMSLDSSDEVQFRWSIDGTAEQTRTATNTPTVAVDTWYHVAVARQGGTLRLFFDGTLLTDTGDPITGDDLHDSTTLFRIGSIGVSGSERFLDGWLDELRVTVGRAIYTAGFTPPTVPFPRD